MADSTNAPLGNVNNAPGNVVTQGPHPGVVAGQRARAGRAETMALLESGRLDAESAKPSVPARNGRPAPEAPALERQERAEPERREEPAATPRVEAKPDPKPDPKPDVEAAPDPETQRRVGQIQAAEARSKQKVAEAKAELEQRAKAIESEWKPRVEAAEKFESLKSKAEKARSNPALLVDLFKELGFSEDHFGPSAQALYAFSKEGQADPSRKAQAEKLMREREGMDEMSKLRREIDELKQGLTKEKQATEFERLQADFLDGTMKAIADDAPTVKAMTSSTKNPKKLRDALWRHTVELTHENDGDAPAFADVVARYQAELDEMGVPRPSAQAAKSDDETKKNNQTADKTNPAKTLSGDLTAPRVPRDATSSKDHRAETRRMVEAGKYD